MRNIIRAISVLLLGVSSTTLQAEYMDLVVSEKTLVQRCVLRGETSSRMVAVGTPGGFNYAFDALYCAPTLVWQGEFLDFQGETNGRGGTGCVVLGIKQRLATAQVPFRIGQADQLPGDLRFQGYRRDAATGNPTFLFNVDGVSIEQSISSPALDVVALHLAFPAAGTANRYYQLDADAHRQVELSDGLRWTAQGAIEIPSHLNEATVTLHLQPTTEPFVRTVPFLTGETVYKNYCRACHSTDGTKLIGPSFKDLIGDHRIVTRNGVEETLTVDEAYLRESVVEPQAAIVKGYEAVPMANFASILTDDQLDRLIGYLSEL